MGIRDEELKRLVNYAKGLNVQVFFLPKTKKTDCDAEWTIDGEEIRVYSSPRDSKISKILALTHELGHHLAHIHKNDRETDPKLEEAIDSDESIRLRKRIYDWEVEGASWWETIYKEVDLKFNINLLYIERDFDLWTYRAYYETGEFPTRRKRIEKRKELRKKYGC